mmetsp:Transcript_46044/g.109609  ORF Transcript_46044/g.109609 Transcript_46044/m.109609 type:complete len:233 (-) Transcript_46044:125-823(-)
MGVHLKPGFCCALLALGIQSFSLFAAAGSIVRSSVDAKGAVASIEASEDRQTVSAEESTDAAVQKLDSPAEDEDSEYEDAGESDAADDSDSQDATPPPNWFCRRRAWCRTDSRRRGSETRVTESRRRLEGTDTRRRQYYVKWIPAPTPPSSNTGLRHHHFGRHHHQRQLQQQGGGFPTMGMEPTGPMPMPPDFPAQPQLYAPAGDGYGPPPWANAMPGGGYYGPQGDPGWPR